MSEHSPFVAFIPEPDGKSIYLLPDTASGALAGDGGLIPFVPVEQKILEDANTNEAIAEPKFNSRTPAEDETPASEIDSGAISPTSVAAKPPDRAINDTTALKQAEEERLEPFAEMNEREKKVPWKERYEVIKTQFPSVENLDWDKVFRADPTIMGNILNDIIKVEVAPKGRPGKRPALDREIAGEIWSQYQGEDYTLLPFSKAVTRLKDQNSVRQFARKVSMSPTYAYKLMMGYKEPSVEDMQLVATAYGKDPSYFYEYRVAFVTAVMAERVEYAPESSIIYYERIVRAKKEHG